eukprot:g1883.t1
MPRTPLDNEETRRVAKMMRHKIAETGAARSSGDTRDRVLPGEILNALKAEGDEVQFFVAEANGPEVARLRPIPAHALAADFAGREVLVDFRRVTFRHFAEATETDIFGSASSLGDSSSTSSTAGGANTEGSMKYMELIPRLNCEHPRLNLAHDRASPAFVVSEIRAEDCVQHGEQYRFYVKNRPGLVAGADGYEIIDLPESAAEKKKAGVDQHQTRVRSSAQKIRYSTSLPTEKTEYDVIEVAAPERTDIYYEIPRSMHLGHLFAHYPDPAAKLPGTQGEDEGVMSLVRPEIFIRWDSSSAAIRLDTSSYPLRGHLLTTGSGLRLETSRRAWTQTELAEGVPRIARLHREVMLPLAKEHPLLAAAAVLQILDPRLRYDQQNGSAVEHEQLEGVLRKPMDAVAHKKDLMHDPRRELDWWVTEEEWISCGRDPLAPRSRLVRALLKYADDVLQVALAARRIELQIAIADEDAASKLLLERLQALELCRGISDEFPAFLGPGPRPGNVQKEGPPSAFEVEEKATDAYGVLDTTTTVGAVERPLGLQPQFPRENSVGSSSGGVGAASGRPPRMPGYEGNRGRPRLSHVDAQRTARAKQKARRRTASRVQQAENTAEKARRCRVSLRKAAGVASSSSFLGNDVAPSHGTGAEPDALLPAGRSSFMGAGAPQPDRVGLQHLSPEFGGAPLFVDPFDDCDACASGTEEQDLWRGFPEFYCCPADLSRATHEFQRTCIPCTPGLASTTRPAGMYLSDARLPSLRDGWFSNEQVQSPAPPVDVDLRLNSFDCSVPPLQPDWGLARAPLPKTTADLLETSMPSLNYMGDGPESPLTRWQRREKESLAGFLNILPERSPPQLPDGTGETLVYGLDNLPLALQPSPFGPSVEAVGGRSLRDIHG